MQLEVKNVSFAYVKNKPILKDVSLSIDKGERVALVGPSGCGKSTLSKIIGGFLRPDSGTVEFEGQPIAKHEYCPIQLIYQHPEKAINPRWKLGKTLTEAWEPDEEFLHDMGIEKEWLTRYPVELSGGEMQRFCIARAMGPKTKFVIADEMSTMLDVITQAQIWELMIKAVKKRNMGMLVVTHNMELAKHICTRVINFEEMFAVK